MEQEETKTALRVLNFLCIGAKVEGLMFNGIRILLSASDSNSERINGQISINIESGFNVFESIPKRLPLTNGMFIHDQIEASKKLCELRLKEIVGVALGEKIPHLFLTLNTGEVLFINGHHDMYESWQVNVLNTESDKEVWEIVAIPGDSLAVWSPENI